MNEERQEWQVIVPDSDGREYVYGVESHPLASARVVAHQIWIKHCQEGGDALPTEVQAIRIEEIAA